MVSRKKNLTFKKKTDYTRITPPIFNFPNLSKSIPNNLGKSEFRTTAITVPRTSPGEIIVSSRILPDYRCPKSDLRTASPLPAPFGGRHSSTPLSRFINSRRHR